MERIAQVRRDTGMTVLVTTHYMEEAEQYCDRVALMHQGRVRALGTPAELAAACDADNLNEAFRQFAGDDVTTGGFRSVRVTRRTAQLLS